MAETDTTSRPEGGVAAQTAKSGAWLYARNIVTSLINVAAMAVLARQLDPPDFALVVLSAVVLRFLSILGDAGVGDYVIYDRKEGREERVHAAFWLNAALTAITTLIGLGLLPLIAGLYREPLLAPVLALMLIKFGIGQLAVVPEALLKRNLEYHKLVARDTFIEVSMAALSVTMALMGYGVWSLVVPGVALAPLRLAVVHFFARWYPRLPIRSNLWRPIARYTFNTAGANFANSLTSEGDTLLVGKLMGAYTLGIYNLGWQTANLVHRNISGVLGKLSMPALSAVSDDADRLRAAYGRMMRLLAIVCFPIVVGMFVLAEELVLTLYGPKWMGAVLPLRIFLIYALRHVIGGPAGFVPNVVGRPEILLRYCSCVVPVYLMGIWIGSHYGYIGVAIAVTVVRTLAGAASLLIAARLLGMRPFEWLIQIGSPFGAAAIMGAVVGLAKAVLLPSGLPAPAALILLSLLGAFTYLGLLRFAYRELLLDLLKVADSLSAGLGRLLRRIAGLSPALANSGK